MAKQGWYSDPPSRKIPYDINGSTVYYNGSPLSLGTLTSLNGFATSTLGGGGTYNCTILLPMKFDIDHVMYTTHKSDGTFDYVFEVAWSSDTTNGSNGVWHQVGARNDYVTRQIGSPVSYYRDPIPVSYLGLRGWRVQWTGGSFNLTVGAIHLWGVPSAGESPHRLEMVDQAGNLLVRDNDFGDQPRNSTRIWKPEETWNETSELYIKNLSPEKTATNVVISVDGNTVLNGMSSYVTISRTGTTYSGSINVDEIGPGEIFGPIYVKHSTIITQALGLAHCKIKAVTANWV